MTLQSQQIKIDMLKRVNESLERENQYLTKQLNYFTQACSSRRNSITSGPIPTKGSIKEKLMSRIDSKVEKEKDYKNDTQSTTLYSSKLSQSGRKMDHVEDIISETYENLISKKIVPKVSVVKELSTLLMENIKESYIKLQTIVNEVSRKNKESERFPKETL